MTVVVLVILSDYDGIKTLKSLISDNFRYCSLLVVWVFIFNGNQLPNLIAIM